MPVSASIYTRTAELGGFFNLYDACLLVAFLAFVWDRKPQLVIPAPFLALFGVLIMGLLNSGFLLGFAYEVLRAFRWAISTPLMLLFSANLVWGEKRVRALLLTLLIGVCLAEIQHLLFAWRVEGEQQLGETTRTLDFQMATSYIWLLAGPYLVAGVVPHVWLQSTLGGLFLVGNLAHQTRSIALGFLGGLVGYYFWFLRGPQAYRWQRTKRLLFIGLAGVVLTLMFGLSGLFSDYAQRFSDTFSHKIQKTGLQSRQQTFYLEMNDWFKGNILIGRGLAYFRIHGRSVEETGAALGHLGYVTYLSQLGIIGLVVYGFYFPLTVLFKARQLMQRANIPPAISYLAALTGACFIISPLIFIFSGSFLQMMYVPGILAGSTYGVWLAGRREPVTPADVQLPEAVIAESRS